VVGGNQAGPGHLNHGGVAILVESSKLKVKILNNRFFDLSFELQPAYSKYRVITKN
jgi:hypothetical protein